ncbi:tripartite tricarboxylate transporter substrate binding protein [Advenella sp. S44]|uniref:Bug family tripartite tricarboxylate transporter substrate binding protein n=1 Tax=Advenella sp. S44 TaxID=1982755 RepID=UPI0013747C1E|nr:tripartite tricarboxylate transporter substrate binding protein [Advenella sp. S44]
MKNMIIRFLLIAAVLCTWSASSLAAYPDKPIRFICTSAAGSPLDLMMRTLAQYLGKELNQTIVVENRPGGTGAVGMANAMNSPADGYTVVSATGSTSFLIADGKSAYTLDDFIFIRGLQAEPSAIAVRKDSPFQSLPQLVDTLKKTPAQVSIGGYATAGFHQFSYYRLQQAAGFRGVWVPFQGGNQAVLALIGDHIQAAAITPSSALPQLKSGELRMLAISTPTRDAYFPNVPTFKEQGYDVVETLWRGVMVKKGTPPEVIKVLSEGMDRVEANPEWKRFMTENVQAPQNMTVEQMQKHVRDEVKTRRAFLHDLRAQQAEH